MVGMGPVSLTDHAVILGGYVTSLNLSLLICHTEIMITGHPVTPWAGAQFRGAEPKAWGGRCCESSEHF